MTQSPVSTKEGYAVHDDRVVSFSHPEKISIDDPLTEVLRSGARQFLASAVEAEVSAFLSAYEHLVDGEGRRRVVRHGLMPAREAQTGIGGTSNPPH